MLKTIEKDILTIDKGYICHCVNCQGVMGSGIAKSIRDKWPVVYKEYKEVFKYNQDFQLLGFVQYVKVAADLYVTNIFGQLYYGNDGARYGDYSALVIACKDLARNYLFEEPCYFPYKFMSDRAGCDWDTVQRIIEYYLPDAIICKLP